MIENRENERRLESWKEIAAYLQRDPKTARRWEKHESLPVHRHRHRERSSVYAYARELDTWRKGRKPEPTTAVLSRWWRRPVPALAGTTLVAIVLLAAGSPLNGGPLHSAAQAVDGGILTRQVWPDAVDGIWSTPSPDGKFLSYVDWETLNLTIRDLEGESHRVLTREGSYEDPFQQAYASAWSPDGERLAYVWRVGQEYQIRVIGVQASEPRILFRGENTAWIELHDWSPDGAQLLVTVSPIGGADELMFIAVTDGSARLLPVADARGAAFSSDGRHVIYEFRQPDSPDRDIAILALDKGQKRTLVGHPVDDALMGCSPDSDWVLFTSNRTGSPGLWMIRLDGGEPILLKPAVGRMNPLGLARDGRFFYSDIKSARDVYELEIDPVTGAVSKPLHKAIRTYEGSNMMPRYSPDGKHLAYVSKRSGMMFPTNRGNALCVRSLEAGEERVFHEQFRRLRVRYIAGPRWLPDSTGVTIGGWGEQRGLYTISLATGEVEATLKLPLGVSLSGQRWSPDGNGFYYVQNDRRNRIARILYRDIKTGAERELHRTTGNNETFSISLSPDGRWLAFVNRAKDKALRVIPAAGGDARELHRFSSKYYGVSHDFSADGQHIFFGCGDQEGAFALCRIPVEGGEPQVVQPNRLSPSSITVHPDGRRIAYTISSNYDTSTDIWVMEDFVPAGEPGE